MATGSDGETSITTRQLAEQIARAVLEEAYDSGDGFMWEHAEKRAGAVLTVLRAHGCWFCRLTDTVLRTEVDRLPFD